VPKNNRPNRHAGTIQNNLRTIHLSQWLLAWQARDIGADPRTICCISNRNLKPSLTPLFFDLDLLPYKSIGEVTSVLGIREDGWV